MKAHDDEAYIVAARNGGDQPVYESGVYLQSGTGRHPDMRTEVVFMTIRPGSTLTHRESVAHIRRVDHTPWAPTVSIRFTDAKGKHWLRDASGQLTEQDQPARTC